MTLIKNTYFWHHRHEKLATRKCQGYSWKCKGYFKASVTTEASRKIISILRLKHCAYKKECNSHHFSIIFIYLFFLFFSEIKIYYTAWKYQYSEFFWSIPPYLVRMRENSDKLKNFTNWVAIVNIKISWKISRTKCQL